MNDTKKRLAIKKHFSDLLSKLLSQKLKAHAIFNRHKSSTFLGLTVKETLKFYVPSLAWISVFKISVRWKKNFERHSKFTLLRAWIFLDLFPIYFMEALWLFSREPFLVWSCLFFRLNVWLLFHNTKSFLAYLHNFILSFWNKIWYRIKRNFNQ